MSWKKFGKIALTVFTVTTIVWVEMRFGYPPPEEAWAVNTTYIAVLDWEAMEIQENIDPDLVTAVLRTYDTMTHANLVEEVEFPQFVMFGNVRSESQVNFIPDPNGLYWEVEVFVDVQALFVADENDNPRDGGAVAFGEENEAQGIHLVD